MITKALDRIGLDDLQNLIDNTVSESKTLEYKRDLPDNSDKGKHGFLSAITSFGNTDGGDLIYGVEAVDGVPLAIHPIEDVIEDQVKLRLENMSRSSIEPRLPKLEMRFISVPGGHVLLVRVEKSWAGPHRLKTNQSGPFFGRHSSGKYEMDVAELRSAFTLSEGVVERIRSFRQNRLGDIHGHSTPIPIQLGCKLALHIIPLSAFTSRETVDLRVHEQKLTQLHPLGRTQQQNSRFTLDGLLNYANINENGRSHAYCQMFRNGVVESVSVFTEDEIGKRIHCKTYEKHLIESLRRYLPLLQEVELMPPFYIFVALVGAHGFDFLVPTGLGDGFGFNRTPSDHEFISLPEIVVSNTKEPAHTLLRPVLDMVWNAFGYAGSRNYTSSGDWIP